MDTELSRTSRRPVDGAHGSVASTAKNQKTTIPPTKQAFLDTMDTVSYGHAVELAKQAIDGGGID